jgi:hypothetical protein
VLERSDADRAGLIGRLSLRDDAAWLAELLMDLEDDVGEIVRCASLVAQGCLRRAGCSQARLRR